MRFLIDAQLPPDLAAWLRKQGHEALHVYDVDMRFAEDKEIWSFASRNEYVIISKDEDFARRRMVSKSGPAVVWVRLPNRKRLATIEWFGRALPSILASLERGDTLVAVS